MGIEKLPWHFLTYFFWLGVMGVEASSWTAEVPKSVSGLQGSCIVIPCSFNYPEPEKKPSKLTGIWLKDTYEVIYHPDSSNIIKDYRGRTELVGDLRQKNCSLRIDPLHDSDKGAFTFRIEIKDHNKYSYKEDTVSITVSSSPDPPFLSVREEVKVGEVVSAFCSVSHSCPSDSPLLTWSHSGTHSVQSQQLTNVQWEVTSSLTFTPSSTDHSQSLVCTAAYKGGKTVKRLKTLNVKYPPEIKVGSACTSDISMVTCLCIVDSEPPGTVEWSLLDGPLPNRSSTRVERHGSVTMVTLQRALGFSETVHCHASNTQGNATLSLTVSTNDKMLMLYVSIGIAALVVAVILISMSACLLNRKGSGRSHRDPPVTCKQEVHTAKCASSDHSTSRKEQTDTSSENHTNYYTNDHVYGNMATEEDGDLYECDGGDDAVYGNV
ncbi:sialic acid-binding Ig-like lectin 13 [Oncorhynchus masou masou]|uniref:sialic acid-binding Ig-like lectin 13 n=1 Tax=Oncorhynchus masou masou TaxID=90313 RepID=UPI003182FE02